jgi:hypothetical protein
VKHNILISTIPWLHFLTPTQLRFSLTYLIQASTRGPCPPQPFPLFGHSPFPSTPPSDWLRLFLRQPTACISTPTFSCRVFLLLTPHMMMEQLECSETSAHKIQTTVNHPKERIQLPEQGESLKSNLLQLNFSELHRFKENSRSESRGKY